jgi:hypothetical protein
MTTTIMTLNLRKKFSHLREHNGLSMGETVAQKQQLLKVRFIAKQRLMSNNRGVCFQAC